MKQKQILRGLAAGAILMVSLPMVSLAAMDMGTTGFTDVLSTNPNYGAIMDLKARGIISGYPDGTFKPDQLVNRVEALKIILLGSGVPVADATGTGGFKDTGATQWYAKYLLEAKSLNIVSGYADGTFKPTQTVNLAENLKMLINAKSIDLSTITVSTDPFADASKTQWYAKYMEYAKEQNWITGDSNNMIYPAQGMTRGKLAALLDKSLTTPPAGTTTTQNQMSQQQTTTTTTTPAVTPSAPQTPAGLNVSIANLMFNKADMTIAQGTTVTWTNNDTVTHTVTSDDGTFNSGNLTPGQSFSYTFNTLGTFTYHCSIHTMMTGSITVKPAIEVPTI